MRIKTGLMAVMMFCTMLINGCTNSNVTYTATDFYLDTAVSVTLYGCGSQKIADYALGLCDYYENIFSSQSEESLLYQLNEEGSMEIDTDREKELARLIEIGIEYGELTDGALDITIKPVAALWNFGKENAGVPAVNELEAALKKVDYKAIEVDETKIRLNGSQVELGAIAKGYIADRIKDYLVENDVDSAIINLGGNVLCLGDKPDKSAFNVGIREPFGASNDIAVTLAVEDLSVVTSGTYERYFYEEDTMYHHILNPNTGYPVDGELVSVTIIAEDSVVCDCLSTGCFVMGEDKARELIAGLSGVSAIFIDEDGEVTYAGEVQNFVKQ